MSLNRHWHGERVDCGAAGMPERSILPWRSPVSSFSARKRVAERVCFIGWYSKKTNRMPSWACSWAHRGLPKCRHMQSMSANQISPRAFICRFTTTTLHTLRCKSDMLGRGCSGGYRRLLALQPNEVGWALWICSRGWMQIPRFPKFLKVKLRSNSMMLFGQLNN
jgi:hypothetical protein